MRPSQLLLNALLLLALLATVRKYREHRIRPVEGAVWCAIWLAAMVVITVPEATALLARALGIGRGVDVVIYLSVPVGFYLVFRLYEKIERLNHDLTRIVRHIALERRAGPGRGAAGLGLDAEPEPRGTES